MRASGTAASGGGGSGRAARTSSSAWFTGRATTSRRQRYTPRSAVTRQPPASWAIAPTPLAQCNAPRASSPAASRAGNAPMPPAKLVMAGSRRFSPLFAARAARRRWNTPRITEPWRRSNSRTPGMTASMRSRSMSPA